MHKGYPLPTVYSICATSRNRLKGNRDHRATSFLKVIKLDSNTDYRLSQYQKNVPVEHIGTFETYYTPVVDGTTREIHSLFDRLSNNQFQNDPTIVLPSKSITALKKSLPESGKKMVLFKFNQILSNDAKLGKNGRSRWK